MANTIFYVYNDNTAWVDAYSTSTNSTIRINWGDGNTETVNLTTSVTSTDHTYSTTNDYAVEIEVTSGTIGIGGGTNVAFGALAAGDVIVGDSVTEIGTGSFVSCSTTKLTIGKDVTSIKENAFDDNQSLTEIKLTSTTPPDLDPSGNNQSAFNHSYIETIKVPLSALSTYQTAYNGYTISIYDTEQEDFVDTLMTSLMETYDDIPKYLDKTGTQLLINEIKRRLGLKQDVVQYSLMPAASADNLGKIYQYVGTTTSSYTQGYFYQCVSDGAASPTYSWEPIAASGEDTSHFIGTTTEWTNIQDKSTYDGGIVVFTDDNDTVVGSLATTVTHGDLRAVTSDGVASALSEIVRPVAYRAYSNAGQTPLGLFARQYYDGRLIFHYRAGLRISNATPAVISFPASDDYDFYVNGSNPLEIAPPTKNSGFKQAWDQYVSTQNNIASACVIFTPKSSSDPAYVSGDTTAESDITAVATVNRMQKNQDGTYSIYCAVQGNYIGPAYVDVLFDSF